MIKVIVFDFDDTLVMSEHIKQTGFIEIFSNVEGAAAVIRDYIINNPGQPRYQAIENILRELSKRGILNFNNLKETCAEYVGKYSRFTETAVIKAKIVPGAEKALNNLSRTQILFINSATPQASIEKVVKGRGWEHFFKRVYGSPPGTKERHLGEIINLEDVHNQEVVIIGDSESDWQCSKQYKTRFIGIGRNLLELAKKQKFLVLENLTELPLVIINDNY